jgi:hypothetical protein
MKRVHRRAGGRKTKPKTKPETMRRLRLGNLRVLLRWRCGPELPDDDAGREYLYELLLPISLGPESDLKMQNVIEVWAPWMDAKERFDLVSAIQRTPGYVRKITGKALGERLRVTSEERERLRLWTIAACDVTDEERAIQQRTKKRAKDKRRRRQAGMNTRAEYLAISVSQRKPWEAFGISRRTWYRQLGTGLHPRGTGLRQVKLLKGGRTLVPQVKPDTQQVVVRGSKGQKGSVVQYQSFYLPLSDKHWAQTCAKWQGVGESRWLPRPLPLPADLVMSLSSDAASLIAVAAFYSGWELEPVELAA